jgi:hypothetical protein
MKGVNEQTYEYHCRCRNSSGRQCSATEEEVDDFETGQGMGHELNPMRPYLETGRHTTWNDELYRKG